MAGLERKLSIDLKLYMELEASTYFDLAATLMVIIICLMLNGMKTADEANIVSCAYVMT